MLVLNPNPFTRFHRAAEAAAYPAVLLVSVLCVALAVSGIALIALTGSTGALLFALVMLFVTLGILFGGISAALSEPPE